MATSTIARTSLKSKTVWTNLDPTQPLGSTTINFGITNIIGVTVRFREYASSSRSILKTIFKPNVDYADDIVFGVTFSTEPYVIYGRSYNVEFAQGVIYFGPAYPMTSYGTYGSANNSYAVPVAVTVYY